MTNKLDDKRAFDRPATGVRRLPASAPHGAPGRVPKLVGRVVDPSALGPGSLLPRVGSQRANESPAAASVRTRGGPAVRARLLARAAGRGEPAGTAPPQNPAAWPSAGASPARLPSRDGGGSPDCDDDLDSIAMRRDTRKPVAGAQGPASSGSLLLTTLLGVLGLGMAFALLHEFAPRPPLVGAVATLTPDEDEGEVDTTSSAVASPAARRMRTLLPSPWRVSDGQSDASLRWVEGVIGKQTFLAALRQAGIELKQAYRLLVAFDGLRDLNRCHPKHEFRALVDRASGRLRAFEYVVSGEEVYQARENDRGLLRGQRLDLKVKKERVEGVIAVSGGFDESAWRAGFEPGLAQAVNKALSGHVRVADFREGDVLRVIAQEVTVLGAFSRYAGVEALEYRTRGAAPLRIYYHSQGRNRSYVDSKGRVFARSRWRKPVANAPISSRFNLRRLHPILRVVKPHHGTDFAAPAQTPVRASAAGTVRFMGRSGPNGNLVTVRHSGGYETGYAHLARFARGLRRGQRVRQQQVIGYVGSTGRSTGPHLHFSAKKNGRFIDPESLGLDAFQRLPASDRKLLSRLRVRYDERLDALALPTSAPGADVAARPASGSPLRVARTQSADHDVPAPP